MTVELLRSFSDPQLAHAVNLVRELPDGLSVDELRSRGPEYERAAIVVSTTYEAIAFLVFREMTSFSIVSELTGGIALVMWRKLARWMEAIREEQAQPSWAEWFQWLAEQLSRESEQKEALPAHEKFADWRPRKDWSRSESPRLGLPVPESAENSTPRLASPGTSRMVLPVRSRRVLLRPSARVGAAAGCNGSGCEAARRRAGLEGTRSVAVEVV